MSKENSFINGVLNQMGYNGARITSAVTQYAYVCRVKGEEGGGREEEKDKRRIREG